MLSLYDYLGRAAGSQLGVAIANIFSKEGVRYNTRPEPIVDTLYGKPINVYPKEFLDEIFTIEGKIKTYYKEKYNIDPKLCQ